MVHPQTDWQEIRLRKLSPKSSVWSLTHSGTFGGSACLRNS